MNRWFRLLIVGGLAFLSLLPIACGESSVELNGGYINSKYLDDTLAFGDTLAFSPDGRFFRAFGPMGSRTLLTGSYEVRGDLVTFNYDENEPDEAWLVRAFSSQGEAKIEKDGIVFGWYNRWYKSNGTDSKVATPTVTNEKPHLTETEVLRIVWSAIADRCPGFSVAEFIFEARQAPGGWSNKVGGIWWVTLSSDDPEAEVKWEVFDRSGAVRQVTELPYSCLP